MNNTLWKNIVFYCALILSALYICIWLYSLDAFYIVNELKNLESDCSYTLEDSIYTIDAICITEKRLPSMTLVEVVNGSRDQILWFSGQYEPFKESFDYYNSYPIFRSEWNPYLQENDRSNELIKNSIKKWWKVSFSKQELAQYYAKNLSYFVAEKDLTNLWNCSRINYNLAMDGIDNYVLNPWEILNANDMLISIKNYCKWETEDEFLFYWWVCWMVSQLFRTSLLNPWITILKRFPHNEWFVQYYWETVWWDDAAVYQKTKQFEIINSGESDIIFKTKQDWNTSILISISWPTGQWVNISKNYINWRKTSVHLDKKVFYDDEILRIEEFDSYYSNKTYEIR